MPTLPAGTYPSYFKNYVGLVETETLDESIQKYSNQIIDFFKNIPADKQSYKYAEGKWTIKEVLQHIIDAERIFTYRALCIARKDKTPLPGFDENSYAEAAAKGANERSWQSLLSEFIAVRNSSDIFLQNLDEAQLKETGTTSGQPSTVEAIAFVIFGHILHHVKTLQERYL